MDIFVKYGYVACELKGYLEQTIKFIDEGKITDTDEAIRKTYDYLVNRLEEEKTRYQKEMV